MESCGYLLVGFKISSSGYWVRMGVGLRAATGGWVAVAAIFSKLGGWL